MAQIDHVLTLNVADSGTTSQAFRTGHFNTASFLAATGTEGTSLKFHGCATEDGTYVVVQANGTDVDVTYAANKWSTPTRAQLDAIMALPYLKAVIGSQTGATTITVVLSNKS